MGCYFVRRLIQAYLGGALSAGDGERLRRHCRHCAACAEALCEAQADARLVASLARVPYPDDDVAPLLARVRAQGQERLAERLIGSVDPAPVSSRGAWERAGERWDALRHGLSLAGFRAFGGGIAMPACAGVPVAAALLFLLYRGLPTAPPTGMQHPIVRDSVTETPPADRAGANPYSADSHLGLKVAGTPPAAGTTLPAPALPKALNGRRQAAIPGPASAPRPAPAPADPFGRAVEAAPKPRPPSPPGLPPTLGRQGDGTDAGIPESAVRGGELAPAGPTVAPATPPPAAAAFDNVTPAAPAAGAPPVPAPAAPLSAPAAPPAPVPGTAGSGSLAYTPSLGSADAAARQPGAPAGMGRPGDGEGVARAGAPRMMRLGRPGEATALGKPAAPAVGAGGVGASALLGSEANAVGGAAPASGSEYGRQQGALKQRMYGYSAADQQLASPPARRELKPDASGAKEKAERAAPELQRRPADRKLPALAVEWKARPRQDLIALLAGASAQARLAAVELGRRRDRRAVPALIRALKSSDAGVRDAAARALRAIGGRHAQAGLRAAGRAPKAGIAR